MLIDKEANLNAVDNNGHTPSWYANGSVKGILIAANNKQEDKKVALKTVALSALILATAGSAGGHAACGILTPSGQMQDLILEKY